MESCVNCLLYSVGYDNQNRDFNDIDSPDSHYCAMYSGAMPDGVFTGQVKCPYYEEKGGNL